MPGGDRSGPMGFGPMTGRGAGFCAGFESPGFSTMEQGYSSRGRRGVGRGMRQGFRGRGRGFGNRNMESGYPWGTGFNNVPFYGDSGSAYAQDPQSRQDEIKYLKQQAGYFAKSLDEVQKRIEKIEAEKESESK